MVPVQGRRQRQGLLDRCAFAIAFQCVCVCVCVLTLGELVIERVRPSAGDQAIGMKEFVMSVSDQWLATGGLLNGETKP